MQEVRAKLREKLGDGPEADFMAAQIALETGGGRSAYNYNIGNRKPKDAEGERYQILTTWELVDGKRVDMNEPFLSYSSLDEALDDYLEYQDRQGHLDAAATGDLGVFNRSLKAKGYYTGEEPKYLKHLQTRLKALQQEPDNG
jgi:flagellum-specific peptidoglycan hydrolase FlgJ